MARREQGEAGLDPTRRQFFRTFGQQTVRNAGALMGAAAEIRRAGTIAARDLLDLGSVPSETVAIREQAADEASQSFSSAYRLTDDAMLVLDQRDLPGRVTLLGCREPSEIASAIRSGAITGGPVLAEVAAYGLVVAISAAQDRPIESRDQIFRSATNTLRAARQGIHAVGWAIDRMVARYDDITATDPASADVTAALRAEADAVASEAALGHAALGRAGARVIAARAKERRSGEPINLLMHGDMGPLTCGLVGTGTAILQSLKAGGRRVHVWVTEAGPSSEGARIAAFQLTQLDVPHTVISDTAVGWLMSARKIHGALLRGDWVCSNGDTAALIGSLGVAVLSAAAGIPVYACAPKSAIAPETPDGSRLALDLRSPAEAMAATRDVEGGSRPAVFGVRLNPMTDVVPADLITALFTETGSIA